jgi:uncharacterized protein (TIGR00106 family)
MTKVHAEIGVLPIGTSSTSLSKYIASGVERLKKIEGIRYKVTPMGTMLESNNVDKIFEASKAVMNTIFEMGVTRVELILKIDERHDKDNSLEDKLRSIEKISK